jgi:hypothetical protein
VIVGTMWRWNDRPEQCSHPEAQLELAEIGGEHKCGRVQKWAIGWKSQSRRRSAPVQRCDDPVSLAAEILVCLERSKKLRGPLSWLNRNRNLPSC